MRVAPYFASPTPVADSNMTDSLHEFDALLLVIDGEMTIACDGKPQTFRAGEICSVPAGTPHTEQFGSGAKGVHFIAGWRYPQKMAS